MEHIVFRKQLEKGLVEAAATDIDIDHNAVAEDIQIVLHLGAMMQTSPGHSSMVRSQMVCWACP